MKLHKIAAAFCIAAALSTAVPASLGTPFTVTAQAHHHGWSGGYSGYNGHYDHYDYDYSCGMGGYHYHHGYGAHLHPNGVCPYGTAASSQQTNSAALLAQQQQAALLAQQQQAALLAQQQQAALLAQQQQTELLAQQQAALLAQQQAQLSSQQQIASIVMQTQAVLKQFGYYSGEINGVWDLPTQQALLLFQTAYGLTADGTINGQIIALFNIH